MQDDGITTLLNGMGGGDEGAFSRLIEEVYERIRAMARSRMRGRFGNRVEALTLQPTALANDVVIELLKQREQWQNTDHFFAIATRLMMRQLADYARHRQALKRGGGKRGVPLDDAGEPQVDPKIALPEESRRMMEAIEQLHDLDPRKAEVVTLHVICSLPLPKVAEHIGVSTPTAERDWRFAKAWLASRIKHD